MSCWKQVCRQVADQVLGRGRETVQGGKWGVKETKKVSMLHKTLGERENLMPGSDDKIHQFDPTDEGFANLFYLM